MTCFRATGMKVEGLKKIVDLAILGDSTIPERKAIMENHKLELHKRQLELDKAYEVVNHKLHLYSEKLSVEAINK